MKKQRKVPSFAGLKPASVLSSRIKKANASRNTRHEVALQYELSRLGLRFQKSAADVPGRPDIVFAKAHLAVFCDGDFWHGRKWNVLRRNLARGTNAAYWRAKISWNMKRDKKITSLLRRSGWRVLRVWESEIKKDPRAVAMELKEILRNRSRRLTGFRAPM
jgi:DNA mismatch endonuclease (patch repair protein)